jgi:hypothetical protein
MRAGDLLFHKRFKHSLYLVVNSDAGEEPGNLRVILLYGEDSEGAYQPLLCHEQWTGNDKLCANFTKTDINIAEVLKNLKGHIK